jgi:hypothetical protein
VWNECVERGSAANEQTAAVNLIGLPREPGMVRYADVFRAPYQPGSTAEPGGARYHVRVVAFSVAARWRQSSRAGLPWGRFPRPVSRSAHGLRILEEGVMASPQRPLADLSVAMARLGWKSLLMGSVMARIAQLPEPWASRWARPVGPRSCQVGCWAPTASQQSTRLEAATSAYQDQSLSKNQWRQHENGCMKKTGAAAHSLLRCSTRAGTDTAELSA